MAQATLTARVDAADKINFDAFCSDANMAHVKKSVQELRSGKGTAHELIEVEDE